MDRFGPDLNGTSIEFTGCLNGEPPVGMPGFGKTYAAAAILKRYRPAGRCAGKLENRKLEIENQGGHQ